jgi:hypothetical protein
MWTVFIALLKELSNSKGPAGAINILPLTGLHARRNVVSGSTRAVGVMGGT